jgi:AraC-like DNA-binding protein
VDPLSAAIEELDVRAATFELARVRVGAPRHVRSSDVTVHVVERGELRWQTAGTRRALSEGELVFALGGTEHVLHATGDDAEVLVGRVALEAQDHPMLMSLPAVLHRRRDDRVARHLDAIRFELASPTDGSHAIVRRLTEVLWIEAIRAHTDEHAECPTSGWFRGWRDPSLARVLSAVHADVAAPWTVASMASAAGHSRSTFASRFADVLGESPLAYVTRWRMFRARTLLRTTDASLDEIAARVGYASAAAFAVAFRRMHDRTPGAYRSAERAANGSSDDDVAP